MRPLSRIRTLLEERGLQPRGSEGKFTSRCPAHDDRRASLSVAEGDDGKVLLKCFANCSYIDITAALGLTEADLFQTAVPFHRPWRTLNVTTPSWHRPIAHEYDYRAEDGTRLFQTVRFADKKDFAQRRPDPAKEGGWIWNLGGVRRVLYRLPEIRKATGEGRTIFIVEGEKDVDALVALGLEATTSPMGAGNWKTEYADLLAGAKSVVVIPDNDEPGEKHARVVVASLQGKVTQVRILRLEGLPTKGDVSDWLYAGHTAQELEALSLPPAEDAAALRHVEDGAALLSDVARFIRRYVVMTEEQVTFAALWILHTYAVEAAEVTPYLVASSPEKRSGKSRLMEVLKVLVLNPWPVVRPSEAVLFRRIAQGDVTLLVDEYDTVFSSQANDAQEGVRAILNAGFERGACVPRCVGKEMKIEDFSVFCPKALFGIGALPDTVRDRSFVIQMRRKKRNETCDRFRRRDLGGSPDALRSRIASWAAAHFHELQLARPALPDALNDRAQDAAECLLAIAEVIGGAWPERARRALIALAGDTDEDSDSLGHQLLTDIRSVLERLMSSDMVSTQELLRELLETDGPWKRYRRNEPLDAGDLARLLRQYRIKPTKFRRGAETLRGYDVAQFHEVFERYLESGPSDPAEPDGTSEQPPVGGFDTVPPPAEQEPEQHLLLPGDGLGSGPGSARPGTISNSPVLARSGVPSVPDMEDEE